MVARFGRATSHASAALATGVWCEVTTPPAASTVTAKPITTELATDPMYWAKHLRQTVRYAEAIAEVWTDPSRVLLEVGPRSHPLVQ